MPDHKYIQIKDGKPKFIDPADGEKIPGIPIPDDLCFIDIEESGVSGGTGGDDNPGDAKEYAKKFYTFVCAPTDKCKAKNKKVDEKRDGLDKEIAGLKTDIGKLEADIKDKSKAAQKPANEQAKGKKAEELKKKETERKAIPNDCLVKYFTGDGKSVKTSSNRFTADELKDQKIETVFCFCQEVKLPDPAKKGK